MNIELLKTLSPYEIKENAKKRLSYYTKCEQAYNIVYNILFPKFEGKLITKRLYTAVAHTLMDNDFEVFWFDLYGRYDLKIECYESKILTSQIKINLGYTSNPILTSKNYCLYNLALTNYDNKIDKLKMGYDQIDNLVIMWNSTLRTLKGILSLDTSTT